MTETFCFLHTEHTDTHADKTPIEINKSKKERKQTIKLTSLGFPFFLPPDPLVGLGRWQWVKAFVSKPDSLSSDPQNPPRELDAGESVCHLSPAAMRWEVDRRELLWSSGPACLECAVIQTRQKQ